MAVITGASGTGTEWKSDRTGVPTGTSDPGSPAAGDIYYKTDTNKIRVYDGSSWNDVQEEIMPVIVGASGTGSEGKADRLGLATGTSDPGSAAAGDMYYKTDDKKIRIFDGTQWNDLASGSSGDATGGTETQINGGWKVHTYTTTGSDQNFEVTAGPLEVEYLLVGGGGGGGGTTTGSSWAGGGGAGGGVTHGTLTLPVGTYKVRVGEGGTGDSTNNGHAGTTAVQGQDGEDSRLFPNVISNEAAGDVVGIVAYGGGGGGSRTVSGEYKEHTGRSGGSGGGCAGVNVTQSAAFNMAWGAYTQVLRKTGNPTSSNDLPFVNAYGSVEFDGDDSFYIRHKKELQIGQHDFCLEFWIKASDFTQGNYKVVASKGSNTNDTKEFALELMNDGKLDWYYSTAGQNWSIETDCTPALVDGSWNHVAFVRRGSKFACFTNGTRTKIVTNHNHNYYSNHRRNTQLQHKKEGGDYTIASFDCSTNYYCQVDKDNPGTYWYSKESPGQYGFTGFLSNYRHVIGHSVYDPDDGSIAVPTEKLTAIPGTVLLCCQHFNQAQYDDVSTSTRAPIGGWYSRQGWDGGRNFQWAGCGGGGACGAGSPAKPNLTHKVCDYPILNTSLEGGSHAEIYSIGGSGGVGYTTDINGTATTYGGGGGGGGADNDSAGSNQSGATSTFSNSPGGAGGNGGGARGGNVTFSGSTISTTRSDFDGQPAADGLGGGGGGASGGNIKRNSALGDTAQALAHGGDGGNGIVIIRHGGTITPPTTSTGSPYFGSYGSGTKALENTTNETNLQMGTGDFTIDGFFRMTTDLGSENCWRALFSIGPGYDDQNSITMYYTSGSAWPVKSSSNQCSYDVCAHLIVSQDYNLASQRRNIDDGDWHHFAIAKTGGFIRQWIDGAFHFEATDTNDYQDGRLYIGRSPSCNGPEPGQHRGWLNSLRIIKGEALYTGRDGISVPREKVVATTNGANANNVKFLGCQSTSSVTDCTVTPTNSWTLSANGSVTLQTDLYTPF